MSGEVTVLHTSQDCHFDEGSMRYLNSQMLRTMSDLYRKDILSGVKRIEDFYIELRKVSVTDARSLLYMHRNITGRSWENINYDDDDYRNLLIKELRSWPSPIDKFNELIEIKIEYVLPKSYLDWFKSDLRCSLFLLSLIHNIVSYNAYKGKDEAIAKITSFLIDNIMDFNSNANNSFGYKEIIRIDEDWKTANLQSIKSTYLKGRTDYKEIKWLDSSNHEQVEWAYNYLDDVQNKPIILKGVFFPETIEEKYELILAHLDRLSNIESHEVGTKQKKGFSPRSYTLYSMKKAWNGLKSYSSKSKVSDGNVNIYKKNQAKLEALAELNKTSVNKLMNKYVENLYESSFLDHENSEKTIDQNDCAESVNDQDDYKTSVPDLELGSISNEPFSNDNVTKPSCEFKKVNPHECSFNSDKKRISLKIKSSPTRARLTCKKGINKAR